MAISLVSGAQLVDASNVSNPSWGSITLPAGRLVMAIGTRAGSSRTTTGITHPAISGVTKLDDSGGVSTGSVYVRESLWEMTSAGGTGTLQVTHDGQAYNTLVNTLELTDLGAVLATDTATGTDAASLAVSATASGVGGGVAACMTEPTNGAAVLNASTWDDASDELDSASGYARQRTVGEAGNVSGQTVTFTPSTGLLDAAGAVLVLFASGSSGGGGAAALLSGAAVPGA